MGRKQRFINCFANLFCGCWRKNAGGKHGERTSSMAYSDNRLTEIFTEVIPGQQGEPGYEHVLKLASEYLVDADWLCTSILPSPVQKSEKDRAMMCGLYSKQYNTQSIIGKGSFGIVKMALRKSDYQQVVVKFIRRKVCQAKDSRYDRALIEFSVLRKLDHPNIVKVLDVFKNAEWIQLVMEKHGSGMNLYEFNILKRVRDEPLDSYIFRQMVSAVSYLHSKNILHRDIKSENMIIDEQFQIKLVDFGSVAFLQPGQRFTKFCGTLSFCSPEVFHGESYEGPELEVWSLGVTLYELVFGKLPFADRKETIKCVLDHPFPVSSELMKLTCWMLNPDVNKRATVPQLENNCWVTQKINISWYKWSDIVLDYASTVIQRQPVINSNTSRRATSPEENYPRETVNMARPNTY